METLSLLTGFAMGIGSSIGLGVIAVKFANNLAKQSIDFDSPILNNIKRASTNGKKSPRFNDDEKAFKVEQETKKKGVLPYG